MGTPNRINTADAATVLSLALVEGNIDSEAAYLSGASQLAFTMFYKSRAETFQDLRGYMDLRHQVTASEYRQPFAASMRASGYATQTLALHSWRVTPTPKSYSTVYHVLLTRSPRKLLLIADGKLIIETDEPAELFAKIDELMAGVDTSKLPYGERRRLDVASWMMYFFSQCLGGSAGKKRSSADSDERAAKILDETLKRFSFGIDF